MSRRASSVKGSGSRAGAELLNALLIVDKPAGMTSMEVVRRLKRASGQKRVGHGGTLDPIATGVVPICFGQATRVMEYLIDGSKEYRGVVEMGVETDTYDSMGEVTAKADAGSLTVEAIERALQSFRGEIRQVPPMYSALKRQGRRLYELAREGIEVERPAREVEIFRLDLLDWSPPLITLDMECSRGVYVRSLAHDLGQSLGCGGHLKELQRRRAGPFSIEEAVPLEDAEQMAADGCLADRLHSPDAVLWSMRAAIVSKRTEEMLRQGRHLSAGRHIPFSRADERVRVYGVDGSFVGIIVFNAASGHWQPDKVFSLGDPDR